MKRVALLFSFILIVCLNVAYAQNVQKIPKSISKKNNGTLKAIVKKTVFRPDSIVPFLITKDGDTINCTDDYNLKQGNWVEKWESKYGEPSMTEVGTYVDGWKYGKWKSYSGTELLKVETYFRDVLNGEILLYENGSLYCSGYYTGSNFRNVLDTVELTNSQTGEIKLVIYPLEKYSAKDSIWRFYKPNSSELAGIELWRDDSMIVSQNLEIEEIDSAKLAAYEKLLPHKNKNVVIPFSKSSKNKSQSLEPNSLKFTKPEKPSKYRKTER